MKLKYKENVPSVLQLRQGRSSRIFTTYRSYRFFSIGTVIRRLSHIRCLSNVFILLQQAESLRGTSSTLELASFRFCFTTVNEILKKKLECRRDSHRSASPLKQRCAW